MFDIMPQIHQCYLVLILGMWNKYCYFENTDCYFLLGCRVFCLAKVHLYIYGAHAIFAFFQPVFAFVSFPIIYKAGFGQMIVHDSQATYGSSIREGFFAFESFVNAAITFLSRRCGVSFLQGLLGTHYLIARLCSSIVSKFSLHEIFKNKTL